VRRAGSSAANGRASVKARIAQPVLIDIDFLLGQYSNKY
jgi:hypothetical protein